MSTNRAFLYAPDENQAQKWEQLKMIAVMEWAAAFRQRGGYVDMKTGLDGQGVQMICGRGRRAMRITAADELSARVILMEDWEAAHGTPSAEYDAGGYTVAWRGVQDG